MATVSSSFSALPAHLSPLLDDGAPNFSIGYCELELLQPQPFRNSKGMIDQIPESLAGRRFLQYGSGKHAIPPRLIARSIVLTLNSDCGLAVEILHLVLKGSSQGVISRNVTRLGNIVHVNGNMLFISTSSSDRISVSMTDHDLHSYIPYSAFGSTFSALQIANHSTT